MQDGLQVARNCEGKHRQSRFVVALAADLVLEECPISAMEPRALYLYRMFHGCHCTVPTPAGMARVQHIWPHPGGLNDQLALVVEAFHIIRSEYATIDREAVEEGIKDQFLRARDRPKEDR